MADERGAEAPRGTTLAAAVAGRDPHLIDPAAVASAHRCKETDNAARAVLQAMRETTPLI